MSLAEDDAVEALGELDLHLHARLLALDVNVSHGGSAAGLLPALPAHRLSEDPPSLTPTLTLTLVILTS